MTLDFTGLDPEIISKFWIYIIGFFIIGCLAGWFFRILLTKSSYNNFCSAKEIFEKERDNLLETKRKYEELQKDVEKSHEYWVYVRRNKLENSDGDPSQLLSEGLKNKSSDV